MMIAEWHVLGIIKNTMDLIRYNKIDKNDAFAFASTPAPISGVDVNSCTYKCTIMRLKGILHL